MKLLLTNILFISLQFNNIVNNQSLVRLAPGLVAPLCGFYMVQLEGYSRTKIFNWIRLSWFGLVYWGLTPQQQPGSYQGGEMMKSVFWWKPEYSTDLQQVTDKTFHIRPAV